MLSEWVLKIISRGARLPGRWNTPAVLPTARTAKPPWKHYPLHGTS